MSKRTLWIISILAVIIISLIVAKKKGWIGEEEGIKVAIEQVSQRTIIETVNASGRIYPEVEVKVSSDVSGEITELTVLEGDSVKRGQVLARIFADILSNQQQQAAAVVNQQKFQVANVEAQIIGLQSAVELAQFNYDRQKKLLGDKVISQAEYEQADNQLRNAKANLNSAMRNRESLQAAVKSAQANLDRASTDVSRTTILSPMEGVVSLLNVKKGERVVGTAQMAGTEMLRIADMRRIEVRVDVTENDIPKVSIGDSAIITVDAYINRKFKGVVYQVASSQTGAANASATAAATTNEVTNYKVFITLLPESYQDLLDPAKPNKFPFKPGMTANADIQTFRKENILTVPLNAVTTREREEDKKEGKKSANKPEENMDEEETRDVVLFLYDPNKKTVTSAKVKTGIQDTRYIEVIEGVTKGQQVVAEPYSAISKLLKNDTKVIVVEKEKLFEVKN